jgi:hypothetical protein
MFARAQRQTTGSECDYGFFVWACAALCVNVCRLQRRVFVSVAPCPTQAGSVTERGEYIQMAIAMRCGFYDSSEARTESSRERERDGLQVRMKWLARVAGVYALLKPLGRVGRPRAWSRPQPNGTAPRQSKGE